VGGNRTQLIIGKSGESFGGAVAATSSSRSHRLIDQDNLGPRSRHAFVAVIPVKVVDRRAYFGNDSERFWKLPETLAKLLILVPTRGIEPRTY